MDTTEKKTEKLKACGRCIHFRASVKEPQGRGLCALYSLVMNQTESCKYGFQALAGSTAAPRARVPA